MTLPLALWVVLGGILALLLLQLLLIIRLAGRVRRLETKTGSARPEPKAASPAPATKGPDPGEGGRLFEAYLDEDPARREWPKKEQFAGFRRWRSERGLNWGQPGQEES